MASVQIAALPTETILRIASLENSEGIKRNILNGRGVVLAISHMGNWELYAQAAFRRPETRFGTVYQALRNPHLDELINRHRRRLGVQTFDCKKGFEAAIALLRAPGSVGVLVDQSAGHGGILDAVLQSIMFDIAFGRHAGDPRECCGDTERSLYFRLCQMAGGC